MRSQQLSRMASGIALAIALVWIASGSMIRASREAQTIGLWDRAAPADRAASYRPALGPDTELVLALDEILPTEAVVLVEGIESVERYPLLIALRTTLLPRRFATIAMRPWAELQPTHYLSLSGTPPDPGSTTATDVTEIRDWLVTSVAPEPRLFRLSPPP